MNILKRINRKYNYLVDKHYLETQKGKLSFEIERNKEAKKIFLFSAPTHSNLGDQAQYFCWVRLFKQYCPDYKLISLSAKTTTDEILEKIKEEATIDDKFYIHSGYLIYDPHPELPFICKVIGMYHEHHITVLPQTINLISDKKQKEVSECFNAHPNLTIISRDEVSSQNSYRLFPNCKQMLWPDVVTSLIGDPDFQYNDGKRDGIMFCIRNDGEKYYSERQINDLKHRFQNVKVTEMDTTIKLPMRHWNKQREKLIRGVIANFARYQLVITDRYHGTIFSQIANTPVIVINSADHKLKSGVKWFPKEYFGENVYFANNLDEAYHIAKTILARKGRIIINPPFFNDQYYKKIANSITIVK